jgi:hypothetical protein
MSYTSPFHPYVEMMASYNQWSRPLRAAQLPVQDVPSIYAVDLAYQMATFFNWESLEIKGLSRFRRNERWEIEMSVIGMAIALSFCLTSSKNQDALPRENREYLVKTFNGFVPGLGSFAVPDSNLYGDSAKWFLRAARYVTECVQRCGLRMKEENPLVHTASIAGNLSGAAAGLKHLEKFEDTNPTGDLLGPLRGSPILGSSEQESPSLLESKPSVLPPPVPGTQIAPPIRPTPPRRDHAPSATSSSTNIFDLLDAVTDKQRSMVAESEFTKWRDYGLEVARLQRIPEAMVRDLLPTAQDADHSVYQLSDLEESLEKLMPGRRQWLLDEGVRRTDFDKYWSAPRWVREYIAKLTRRNFELEVQSKLTAGTERNTAFAEAMFFIPLYVIAPAEDGDNALHLPIELFERARRHLVAVDDKQYCDYMVKHELLSASDYVRRAISEGVL